MPHVQAQRLTTDVIRRGTKERQVRQGKCRHRFPLICFVNPLTICSSSKTLIDLLNSLCGGDAGFVNKKNRQLTILSIITLFLYENDRENRKPCHNDIAQQIVFIKRLCCYNINLTLMPIIGLIVLTKLFLIILKRYQQHYLIHRIKKKLA